VHVITGCRRFFAALVEVSAHVDFIRSFVTGKTDIAVDAVGTVFRVEGVYISVYLTKTLDHLLYKKFDILFCIQVNGLVFFKPGLVVVLFQVLQELDRGGLKHSFVISSVEYFLSFRKRLT